MKQFQITFSKPFISIIAYIILSVLLLTLSACGSKSDLTGSYKGTAGSFLNLNHDGSCVYGEDDETGAGTGTWYIEDNTLYIEVDNLNYRLYTNIEDFDNGFLLEGEGSSWRDEYFSKEKN